MPRRTTSIWGTNQRLSSPHAALANGTQVQGFELDDVHRQAVLHVGAVTLPALIAAAESHNSLTGREFLTAAVAGYEIGPRVGKCMGQDISARAGTPARPSAYSRPRPARRADLGSMRSRPCMRSASAARNRPG